ncbi:MAG: hypothetical protein OEM59_21645 [Rhodospirillales bacterium]|nr:hypothetical protein [Rhodospirillales bacterium]
MTASLPVMILVTLTAAAAVYAFWLSIREGRRTRELAAWLKASQGERWQALPWFSRELFPKAGIETLRRQGLGEDPDFAARYGEIRRLRRREALLLVLGAAAIVALLLGTRLLGWHW